MKETYNIKLITPLFSRGSYEHLPEVRPPSIRGVLHWWLRAVGGSSAEERSIFGSVHKGFGGGDKGASASKIVIRVSDVIGPVADLPTLPHKNGGQAASKSAFAPGASFSLHISTRLGGLSKDGLDIFHRALEAWLNLGSLGLRSTRGAGSFSWTPGEGASISPPLTFDDYSNRCKQLINVTRMKFALLPNEYTDAEKARKVASDTIGGRSDTVDQQDSLKKINFPLGKLSKPRKTSPLRFRIVGLENKFRVAAIWDAREDITGNKMSDLSRLIDILCERKPELGNQLKSNMIN